MLDNIKNSIQTALSFLQLGKSPINCPSDIKKRIEDTSHFSSKKFFIIFTSLLILAFVFYSSVFILFLFPKDFQPHITAYVTIFSETMKVFGLIIATYLGVQSVADFAFNSSSNVSNNSETINQSTQETKNENVQEQILSNNAKEDDYNISEVDV